MDILKRLQVQPEHIRRIILWGTVIVLGLILGVWWIKRFSQRLENFSQKEFIEQLKIPDFKEELKKNNQISIPKHWWGGEETLQELKKILEEITGQE